MIDTNLIPQAAQDVATIKTQLSPYLPALAVAAAWAGREIRNVNLYVENVAAKIIAHGGIGSEASYPYTAADGTSCKNVPSVAAINGYKYEWMQAGHTANNTGERPETRSESETK